MTSYILLYCSVPTNIINSNLLLIHCQNVLVSGFLQASSKKVKKKPQHSACKALNHEGLTNISKRSSINVLVYIETEIYINDR